MAHRAPYSLEALHSQRGLCPNDCLWHGVGGPEQPGKEAFHAQSPRKVHRISPTYYTKVIAPDIPTTANQQLRVQTSHPPAQLKLFGHILRVPVSRKEVLFRDSVCTQGGCCWRVSQKESAQNTLGGAVCGSSLPLDTGAPEPSTLKTPQILFCVRRTSKAGSTSTFDSAHGVANVQETLQTDQLQCILTVKSQSVY